MATKKKSSRKGIGKKVAIRNLKGKKEPLTDKEARVVRGGLSGIKGVR